MGQHPSVVSRSVEQQEPHFAALNPMPLGLSGFLLKQGLSEGQRRAVQGRTGPPTTHHPPPTTHHPEPALPQWAATAARGEPRVRHGQTRADTGDRLQLAAPWARPTVAQAPGPVVGGLVERVWMVVGSSSLTWPESG
ncbi:unnamed protein product [Boreogadus saida]